jgi:hypothetical protein
MSSADAAPRAAGPVPGAPTRAAGPANNARAEASRRNGAKSRGPKTPEGRARAAQNALKHGMRALTHVVLPDESAVEFAALDAAMVEELAPEGALQLVLARRVAVAAWRLARADRMETELFAERCWDNRGVGVALIRDGNGTRSFETLLRYRNAAIAEFMRALKTLKALQAEAAAPELPIAAAAPVRAQRSRSPARAADAHLPLPNEPEPRPKSRPARRLEYALPDSPAPGRTLHEPAAPWTPNEPEPATPPAPRRTLHETPAPRLPNEPAPATALAPAPAVPVAEAPPRHRQVVVDATGA